MLSFRTTGFNGYAVKYSPFYDNKIAVATSLNYGLVGNGRLYILSLNADGSIVPDTFFDTQDGLFDVSWSETHENQAVVGSGDGTVSIFDIKLSGFPVKKYLEHKREVFSVCWNLVDKSIFSSSSWDGTVKIWTPSRSLSILTLQLRKDTSAKLEASVPVSHQPQHQNLVLNPAGDCIYKLCFSPHDPTSLISCNSASHLQSWDIRAPNPLVVDMVAHNGLEALSCDWNKYRSTIVLTAGVDKTVRIWDLRFVGRGPPVNELIGHEFAVRDVKWSPHQGDVLLTSSYDMTARVWRDNTGESSRFSQRVWHGDSLINTFQQHSEFVIGGDWSMWGEPGWCATTGWDEMVYVWNSNLK